MATITIAERKEFQLTDERETAQILRVSRACLRRWRATGQGPPWVKCGERLIRYDLAALRAWIERQAGIER
jgi:predicted DNA-binding transcriptional regulator AlpA